MSQHTAHLPWPRSRWVPNLTVFAASAAIMLMEMVAGALVSRHIGMSLYTWTAIIGVVMAGMAVGNAAGGRIADRASPARALAFAFLLAAVGCVLILMLNEVMGGALAGMGLPWPLRIALHVGGVFLLPAALLGAITPLVAKLALEADEDAGRTVGGIFAWGVGGSIFGTFITGYYLVYAVGVRELILVSAGVLAAMGVYFLVASVRHGSRAQQSTNGITHTSGGPARVQWLAAYATVFASNTLFMMMELAASRVITRQYGASLYTWTAVIGVMLAGITLGNYVGGRIADADASRQRLGRMFIIASVLAFGGPIASRWMSYAQEHWLWLGVLPWPVQITLHMLASFFLPCIAIGTISPIVVKRLMDAGAQPGRSIGGVYAWGSAGGIAGTFATGYFLIDWLGSLPVLGLTTALLAVVGVIFTPWPRRVAWAAAVCVLFVLAWTKLPQTLEAARLAGLYNPPGSRVVYEDESNYSYIAVTQSEDNPRERQMILDKLMHSEVDLDKPQTLKYEYEWIYETVLGIAYPDNAPISTMVIGGGGYAFPHYLELARLGSYVETAEIDPAVTEAAHAAFGLPRDTSVQIYNMDARNRVDDIVRAKAQGQPVPEFDCILGDSINDYTVPRHLTTLEFARQVHSLLKDDGIYMLNHIDLLNSGLFLGALVTTLQEVFPQVEAYNTGRLPSIRDTFVVVCCKSPRDLSGVLPSLTSRYEYKGWQINLDELLTPERRRVLTDNHAPVDLLLRPVIATRQADRGAEYFDLAREALLAGDADEALRLAQRARRYQDDWPVLHELMAVIYERKGDSAGRIEALRRAAETNPVPAQAYTTLGEALAAAGRKPEAYEALGRAVSSDMNHVAARTALGKLALNDGRLGLALEQWQALTVLTPEAPGAWYNLGLTHAGMQQYEQAIDAWRKAIGLDAHHFDSYHNLALALHLVKRDDEARQTLQALRANGGTPDAKLEAELGGR